MAVVAGHDGVDEIAPRSSGVCAAAALAPRAASKAPHPKITPRFIPALQCPAGRAPAAITSSPGGNIAAQAQLAIALSPENDGGRIRDKKRQRLGAALDRVASGAALRRRRCLRRLRRRRLHRSGILALGLDIAIDELDHRDRSGITVAEACLEHAGITAVAVLVAGSEHLEQLLD